MSVYCLSTRHCAVCDRITEGSEKQWKSMRRFPAGVSQQAHELALGRLPGRIRHVVDEPDREVHVGMLRTTEFVLSPQLRRREAWTDDQPPLFQQDGHAGPLNDLLRGLEPLMAAAGCRERLEAAE